MLGSARGGVQARTVQWWWHTKEGAEGGMTSKNIETGFGCVPLGRLEGGNEAGGQEPFSWAGKKGRKTLQTSTVHTTNRGGGASLGQGAT